jgi:hypothetical protein
MAECGTQLAQLAHEHGADLFYEAAVGGAIPILRALRISLAGERINRVMGIVNGTTNFILTKMTSEGSDYRARSPRRRPSATPSRSQRRRRGLRRRGQGADPLVPRLRHRTESDEVIAREGITGVRDVDVEFARRSGYVIKLLGVAERVGDTGCHVACTRPSSPQSPAGLGARRHERGLRRGREEWSLDVARPRAPVANRPRRPCWATCSTPRVIA